MAQLGLAGVTLLATLAGCGDHDPFIAPGGGGGGGGGGGTGGTGARDAGIGADASTAQVLRGRICRVRDVRAEVPCTTADGTGLFVGILETGAQALVGVDGTFTLPTTGDLVTLVTSTDHPVWFGATMQVAGFGDVTLPVVSREDIAALLDANFVVLEPGGGILVVHVRAGGSPVAGAGLSFLDGIAPFYDLGDPLFFAAAGPTGPLGTAIYFNAGAGIARFTVTFAGSTTTYEAFVATESVTWALAVLPSS